MNYKFSVINSTVKREIMKILDNWMEMEITLNEVTQTKKDDIVYSFFM